MHPAFYLSRPRRGWNFVEIDRQLEFRSTHVGNDVWIGAKAIIRDGISIGSGVIIGAGAVVVNDLAPYGVYAGVPAKLIRFRFDRKTIEYLLQLEWWNRSDDWFAQNGRYLNDAESFLQQFPPIADL